MGEGRLRRAAAGSIGAGLVAQGALVVSGPVVARSLGADGRGELALLVALALLSATVAGLGLPAAAAFALARADLESWRPDARTVVAWLGALAAVVALAGVLTFGAGVDRPWTSATSVLAAPLAAAAIAAFTMALAVLQGLQRFLALNWTRPVPAVLFALLVVVLAVAGEPTPVRVLVLFAVANAVGAIAAARVAFRRTDRPGPLPGAGHVGYGLRSLLGTTGAVEAYGVDQAVAGITAQRSELGFYAVGAAFAGLSGVLVQGFGHIVSPLLAAAEAGARGAIVRRWLLRGAALVAVVTLGVQLVVSPVLDLLFGEEFAAALPAARLLILAGAVAALRRLVASMLLGLGLPGRASLAEGCTLLLAIPLIAVGAALAGAVGAAAGLLVAGTAGLVVAALGVRSGLRRSLTSVSAQPSASPR